MFVLDKGTLQATSDDEDISRDLQDHAKAGDVINSVTTSNSSGVERASWRPGQSSSVSDVLGRKRVAGYSADHETAWRSECPSGCFGVGQPGRQGCDGKPFR